MASTAFISAVLSPLRDAASGENLQNHSVRAHARTHTHTQARSLVTNLVWETDQSVCHCDQSGFFFLETIPRAEPCSRQSEQKNLGYS